MIQGLVFLGPLASRDEPRTGLWLVMGSEGSLGGSLSLVSGSRAVFLSLPLLFELFFPLAKRKDWKKSVYGERGWLGNCMLFSILTLLGAWCCWPVNLPTIPVCFSPFNPCISDSGLGDLDTEVLPVAASPGHNSLSDWIPDGSV